MNVKRTVLYINKTAHNLLVEDELLCLKIDKFEKALHVN